MKKSILVILLAMLCCVPCYAQRKSKRAKKAAAQQTAVTSRPTIVSFKGATPETAFILFFDGKKINKDPQNLVEIKDANLNTDYNIRVVVKKPKVNGNMAFTYTKIQKKGEVWIVNVDQKGDKAELLTLEQYRQKNARKMNPNGPKPHKVDRSGINNATATPDEPEPDNVIVIKKNVKSAGK